MIYRDLLNCSPLDDSINEKLMFQLYGRSTFGRLASPRITCSSKIVITVRFKDKIVFSCFFFQMLVITQLRDKWYGHGVRNRS